MSNVPAAYQGRDGKTVWAYRLDAETVLFNAATGTQTICPKGSYLVYGENGMQPVSAREFEPNHTLYPTGRGI